MEAREGGHIKGGGGMEELGREAKENEANRAALEAK